MIVGNVIGGIISMPDTVILVDSDGTEYAAVFTDEEVSLTGSAKTDVREGVTVITNEGVVTGEKFIPSYYVTETTRIIMPDKPFAIKLPDYSLYDYTKLQAIICPFNKTMAKSVSCEKVAIDDKVYNALSTDVISEITLNHEQQTIELGLVNTATTPYLIRYFTYKEVY